MPKSEEKKANWTIADCEGKQTVYYEFDRFVDKLNNLMANQKIYQVWYNAPVGAGAGKGNELPRSEGQGISGK